MSTSGYEICCRCSSYYCLDHHLVGFIGRGFDHVARQRFQQKVQQYFDVGAGWITGRDDSVDAVVFISQLVQIVPRLCDT